MGGAAAIVIFLGLVPIGATRAEGIEHLVISEIATGGVGANDEFIELFNPGTQSLSLAGLEVAYVSASGATASQRAAWAADAPAVPPGGHVLLANDAGVHAPGADVLYHGGLAEGGGTVILRWIGALTAIDAVAWGAAAGSWLEGNAAPAPPPGSSLERLTSDGGMQDTDDNATDFVERAVPSPQAANTFVEAASPTASPTATPTATPAATPAVTPTAGASIPGSATPTASATALPGPTAVSIAAARAMANGTPVTVDGTALTASAFGDGGGHLADGSGGIAVIVEGGSFAAGFRVVVTGTLDDRFAQRTIRARVADVQVLGEAPLPQPAPLPTGSVGEDVEGRLVQISATILGAPTPLSAGLAFEVDDGSGGARVVVGSATAIDASSWATGARVELVGVVGQRDSSGSGTSGYRILPRSSADVLRVTPPESPAPSASAAPTASTTPSAAATDAPAAVTPIESARSAPTGTRLTLRGVVTLPPGVVDPETAVIQDETAAIVLRVDEETGPIREGDLIEVDGLRSTKSGMETLRGTSPARVQSSGAESAPLAVTAADVTERIEAQLVAVTGRLLASARRAASGTVSFDIEDATGVIRIVLPASLEADDTELVAGVQVEVIGVVGQETTAADPLAGYRLWPRAAADVRVLASPAEELELPSGPSRSSTVGPPSGGADLAPFETPSTLDAVGTAGLGGLRIGATLVMAEWPGLGVGGLLWDGMRLVAVSAESATGLAPFGARRPPIPLALSGLRAIGVEPRSGALLVALGADAGDVTLASGDPAPPRATLPSSGEPAVWVTLVGRLSIRDGLAIEVGQATVALDLVCGSSMPIPDGVVSVTGIGVADPPRVIVPCDGIRAAPTLARTVVATPEGPEGTQATPTVDEVDRGGVPSSSDRRRTLAGWLLGLAVLVVSGATLVWRRLAAALDTERADDREAPVDEPHVPPLTLVRLRRDRSS